VWPLVASWRYKQVVAALERQDAHCERFARERDVARYDRLQALAMLDSLLVAFGLLDSEWVDAGERVGRDRWVIDDMNYRLATAVQFRETEQAGGMKGTGYVNGLVSRARRNREQIERRLP